MSEPVKLRRGRLRHQRQRQRDAARRVKAYRQWLKAGADFRRIPLVPSDNDFKLTRGQRES